MPLPFTSAGQPDKPVFSSSKETSLIVVEKKNEVTASLGASSSSRHVDGGSSSRSQHDANDVVTGSIQSAVEVTGGVHDVGATAALMPLTDAIKTTAQLVCAPRDVVLYKCF